MNRPTGRGPRKGGKAALVEAYEGRSSSPKEGIFSANGREAFSTKERVLAIL